MKERLRKISLGTSIALLLICLVLVTGSTFSLFTSGTDNEIAITSGSVSVTAKLENLLTWSLGETVEDAKTDGTFANNGSFAKIEDGKVIVTNMTPGDNAQVTINITNESNVSVVYRLEISIGGELADVLDITTTQNGEEIPFEYGATKWTHLEEPKAEIADIVVNIAFPGDNADEFDNLYQGKECEIAIKLTAVQGNGDVVDPFTKIDDHNFEINSPAGMMLINNIIADYAPSESNIINLALTKDMDMTGYDWTPIDLHWVNVDGQGHTVSNLNCGTDANAKSGFAGYAGATTVKNITLENVTAAGEQAGVFVGLCEAGKYENVTIKGENSVSFFDADYYAENYAGIGAVIGADVSGVADKTGITIAEGATINVNYDGLKTAFAECVSDLAFNLAINVTNNGTVTTEGNAIFVENGLEMIYNENGEKTLYLVPADYPNAVVEVPEGVINIGRYSVPSGSKVEKIVLPSSVKAIEDYAFAETGISEVVLNEGLESIGNRSFNKMLALTSITLPESLKSIAQYAFQGTGLTSLTVPAGVETIAQGAFAYNSNLTTIVIEGSPTIGDGTGTTNPNLNYVGRACPNLTTVILLGDSISFVTSGMTFSNAESGVANKITVYVKNQEVADAYNAATTHKDYTLIINDAISAGYVKEESSDTYSVFNGAGLETINGLFANSTAGAGVVINLLSDIDMAGYTWAMVDSHVDWKCYLSEFNGNGHTISNLTVNGQAMFKRFAGVGTVTIKDLTFDGANVNSNGTINTSILTVQTYQNIVLDNVDVKNSSISGGYKVAPLIATVYNESSSTITATLKNCDVYNVEVTSTVYDFYTAGMVAFVYTSSNDSVEFENCTITDVVINCAKSYDYHAAIYCDDNATLYNEAEGVIVTNVTFVK